MKTMNFPLWKAVSAVVIGLILVTYPEEAGLYLVIAIGAVFLIPSIIALVGYYHQEKELRDYSHFPLGWLGSLLFGLWLVVTPGFFADLLTYVLGFILVMGGVQQIASLMAARSWTNVATGFYVMPVIILLAGLFAILNPIGVRATAFIIIGITSLVYGINELINWFKFTRIRPKADSDEDDKVEDAVIIDE